MKTKMIRTALAAAICMAWTAKSFAAALDLAGVDRTVTDVAELASYDEGVRIFNAETLDTATFGDTKSLATSTAQIAALPPLAFVASDGTTIADTSKWHYRLSLDRHTLKFGAHRGLMVLVR